MDNHDHSKSVGPYNDSNAYRIFCFWGNVNDKEINYKYKYRTWESEVKFQTRKHSKTLYVNSPMYNKKTQQPKLENNIYISDDQIKFQLKKEAGVNEEERFLSPLDLCKLGHRRESGGKRWKNKLIDYVW